MKNRIGIVFLVAACGGKTEMGDVVVVGYDASVQNDSSVIVAPDAGVSSLSAVVLDSCSPTDAPAWAVELSPATCAGSATAVTTITIWPPPVEGVPYQLTIGNSLLSHCKGNVCTMGGTGTIVFDLITPRKKTADGGIDNGQAFGRYSIQFVDGTSETQSFQASLCRNGGKCG